MRDDVLLPECVGTIHDGESPAAAPASTSPTRSDDDDDDDDDDDESTFPEIYQITQEKERAWRAQFKALGDKINSDQPISQLERETFEALKELLDDVDKTRHRRARFASVYVV